MYVTVYHEILHL